MKILIVAGGTGSIALQTGLYNMLDKQLDGVDTKILTNAWDNGKSTGAVRQVMGGHILGPSDVRKNQTTRLELENPRSPWLPFLNIRFTVESSKAKQFCLDSINALDTALEEIDAKWIVSKKITVINLLREAVEEYFAVPIASQID